MEGGRECCFSPNHFIPMLISLKTRGKTSNSTFFAFFRLDRSIYEWGKTKVCKAKPVHVFDRVIKSKDI